MDYARRNLTIELTTIHIDFEVHVGMHTVLGVAILSATIKYCRFYLWAKPCGGRSKLLGLVLLITKTTGVEHTDVEDCFTKDIMPDCPDDQNCNKFADYLLENYVTFDSKFTPHMWAGDFPQKRTNNHNGTESLHVHFNEQFYASHPGEP